MFIIISGVSGAGKTTLINTILNNSDDFAYPKCVTTRLKRISDNCNRYTFVSPLDFEKYIYDDALLEYQLYKGNYYGTLKESYYQIQSDNKIAITDMGYNSIKCLKGKLDDIINILIDTDLDLVVKRMIERGESYETIKLRLENIKNERDSLLDISDYKINNNDNINNTFKEFTRVLKKRRIIKWN